MSFIKQMEELESGEAQIRRENEIVQELREKYQVTLPQTSE